MVRGRERTHRLAFPSSGCEHRGTAGISHRVTLSAMTRRSAWSGLLSACEWFALDGLRDEQDDYP